MRAIRDLRECFSVDEDDVILYIQQNLEPEMVYENQTLVNYVRDNNNPEDVFPTGTLDDWAKSNGYFHQDDQ